MNMSDYRKIFEETSGADNYQRVESDSLIDWYLGKDNRTKYSLFCIVNTEPKDVMPTQLIDAFVGVRKDGRYGITFSLVDDSLIDLFAHFCEDMVTTSLAVNDLSRAADYVSGRYHVWQRFFSKTKNGFLSFEEIKGLIGEIIILKDCMIEKYGEDKALQSWSGTEMTDQDFSVDSTWYEVKTTVSGSGTVKISSVEQLDSDQDGHLAVVTLDKTSESDSTRITLNSAYMTMCNAFTSDENREQFKNRVLAYGYLFDKYYDKYGFKYKGYTLYKVNKQFPCIRKENLPTAATSVKYDLNLPVIESFKEEQK